MIATTACALLLASPSAEEIRFPVDTSDGHIAVQVFIGDHGPYRFNLDTGASVEACIDLKLKEELGVPVVGTTMNSDGHKTVRREIVRIPELLVADKLWTRVRALADDYSWVAAPDAEPVMGLLGFALFPEGLLTIDYPAQEVIAGPGELDPNEEHVVDCARGSAPIVEVSIGKAHFDVIVDTGGDTTLFLPENALEELEVRGELRSGQSRSVYGTNELKVGTLAEPMKLAGHEFSNLQVVFSKRKLGIIGQGVLSKFVITFDRTNGRMRLALPPKEGLESKAAPRREDPGCGPGR